MYMRDLPGMTEGVGEEIRNEALVEGTGTNDRIFVLYCQGKDNEKEIRQPGSGEKPG
jgi:hypothetical protein